MPFKNKILIISWGVYPDQNGSSVIVHNLAKALGEDKVVIVGELPLNTMQWDQVNYPLYHIDINILKIQKGIKYHKWFSFFRSFYKIKEIIRHHNCSKIIAVFPDEYFLCLSYYLAKCNKIELYTWLHNTYIENRTGFFKLFAKLLQPRVFAYSTKIFCMSDGLTQYYKDNYTGVIFKTLRHAFDVNNSGVGEVQFQSKGAFTFAYSGSLNESCKEASIRICKVISEKENCKLVVFGKKNVKELILAGVPSKAIQSYEFLSQEEFDRTLQASDFMILAHGFRGQLSDVEYDTIFPTRTIPLLYSGKPIIVHAPDTSFLAKWFQVNNCGYVITSEDHIVISKSIESLLVDFEMQNTLVSNAMKMSSQFDSNNIANELLSLVNFNQFD